MTRNAINEVIVFIGLEKIINYLLPQTGNTLCKSRKSGIAYKKIPINYQNKKHILDAFHLVTEGILTTPTLYVVVITPDAPTILLEKTNHLAEYISNADKEFPQGKFILVSEEDVPIFLPISETNTIKKAQNTSPEDKEKEYRSLLFRGIKSYALEMSLANPPQGTWCRKINKISQSIRYIFGFS